MKVSLDFKVLGSPRMATVIIKISIQIISHHSMVSENPFYRVDQFEPVVAISCDMHQLYVI